MSFDKLRTGSLLAIVPLALTGCLGDVMEVFCETSPDSDHCFQAAAVQEAEPETCAKVEGEGFVGQNPPRDKCYLQIAENVGDPTVCDKIEGGITSYSKEECLDGVFRNHTVDSCDKSEDQIACRTAYAKKFGECGDGYYLSKKTNACVKREPTVAGTDDDIESKVEGDLNTIKDAATGKYMELLEGAIEAETDPAKLAGLQAYKDFLDKGGEQLETVGTSIDQLKEIKKIFLDAYDPSMDVEKMPVNKILDPGLFDKVKSRLFGNDEPTERSKADDALSVYEAMLKRQGEIDYLKKGKMDRLTETITSKVKDRLTGDLTEKVQGIVESAAGPAFKAVTFVGDAVKSFQEEAQKEMFAGLASAYNRQRDAIKQSNPNLDAEELHKRTVQSVKQDPYADVPNAGFVKYGNILENPDCQDGGNPLCIDDRVFWTAMDKAYVYTHK